MIMTMTDDQIIEKVNTFLADEFEINQSLISPSASLKDTLDLDSLDYVDLVVIIESNFGFKVKGEDFVGIKTFQDFYNYVIAKLNAN
jgi:acyl carrier protein